jgi:hypothetical protein
MVEGNGKIPLGRQVKRSLKGRAKITKSPIAVSQI